jgi:hypothetical protein
MSEEVCKLQASMERMVGTFDTQQTPKRELASAEYDEAGENLSRKATGEKNTDASLDSSTCQKTQRSSSPHLPLLTSPLQTGRYVTKTQHAADRLHAPHASRKLKGLLLNALEYYPEVLI